MQRIQLTKNQVDIVLKNICKLRHIGEPKEIYSGKPKWDAETLQKYNYEEFAKFASKYTIYVSEGQDHNEIFIVINSDKTFEKYQVLACSNLYHLFEKYLKRPQVKGGVIKRAEAKKSYRSAPLKIVKSAHKVSTNLATNVSISLETGNYIGMEVDTDEGEDKYRFADDILSASQIDQDDIEMRRPYISICFTSSLAEKQMAELNIRYHKPIFDIPYRFIILPNLYFTCGSKTQIGLLTSEHEILPFQKSYNGKDYAIIFSNDPMVIAMNGMPGELYKYNQVMFDHGVYKTVNVKRIQRAQKNPDAPVESLISDYIIDVYAYVGILETSPDDLSEKNDDNENEQAPVKLNIESIGAPVVTKPTVNQVMRRINKTIKLKKPRRL